MPIGRPGFAKEVSWADSCIDLYVVEQHVATSRCGDLANSARRLGPQLTVMLPATSGTHTVAELCLRALGDVCFHLLPVPIFITDSLTRCTDWEQPAQQLNTFRRGVAFRECFPEAQLHRFSVGNVSEIRGQPVILSWVSVDFQPPV